MDADLHRELRRLAADYNTRLYVVASLLLEDCLSDREHVAVLLARLSDACDVSV